MKPIFQKHHSIHCALTLDGNPIRQTCGRGDLARTGHFERGLNVGNKGFTLIEIMVVITILAILAALVAPRFVGKTDDARIVAAKVQIKNIEGALAFYKLDNAIYPSTEQGLDALVLQPTIGATPNHWRKGGYLDKVPNDPWSRPYVYFSPGTHGDYDMISYGADGEPGGEDKNGDIESWNLE